MKHIKLRQQVVRFNQISFAGKVNLFSFFQFKEESNPDTSVRSPNHWSEVSWPYHSFAFDAFLDLFPLGE